MLTKQELQCLNNLVDAWNVFMLLPELHPSDMSEFSQAIHVAQNIIMARPVQQTLGYSMSDKNKDETF
jgi:hypothetical protein